MQAVSKLQVVLVIQYMIKVSDNVTLSMPFVTSVTIFSTLASIFSTLAYPNNNCSKLPSNDKLLNNNKLTLATISLLFSVVLLCHLKHHTAGWYSSVFRTFPLSFV